MNWVFADSSYWVGLVNQRDQLHAKIVALVSALRSVRVVTSEMVLTEALNGFSGDQYLRIRAGAVVAGVRQSPDTTIVPQTAEQFAGALHLYMKAADKEWSLTDCASFLIMEQFGIQEALTHDVHFLQAGFKALLR